MTNFEMADRRRAWQAPIAIFLTLFLTCLFYSTYSKAHTLGQSYVFANVEEAAISGHLELPIDILEEVIQKRFPDFKLQSTNVSDDQWQKIEPYLRAHFRISQDGVEYPLQFGNRDALEIEIAKYLVVDFVAEAPGQIPQFVEFYYSAFLHLKEEHRGGLVIANNYKTGVKDDNETLTAFFAPGRENFVLNTLGDSWIVKLNRFIVEGAIHIWIGYDHVLFVITLLLMSVVAQAGRNYQAVESLRPALVNVFKLVTLFTIAHTITLFLGLKGWVNLPSNIVESIIALSIIVVAVNNILPFMTKRVGLIIFMFGLFHGLGFASVLEDLLINREEKLFSLLGFNIGVELAQLAIVSLVFPVLYLLRLKSWYQRWVLETGSASIALVGAWWLFSRIV